MRQFFVDALNSEFFVNTALRVLTIQKPQKLKTMHFIFGKEMHRLFIFTPTEADPYVHVSIYRDYGPLQLVEKVLKEEGKLVWPALIAKGLWMLTGVEIMFHAS